MFSPVVGLHSPGRKHLFFKRPFSVGPLQWQGAASSSVAIKANAQKKESLCLTLLNRREPGIRPHGTNQLASTLLRCQVSCLHGTLVSEGAGWSRAKLGEREVPVKYCGQAGPRA